VEIELVLFLCLRESGFLLNEREDEVLLLRVDCVAAVLELFVIRSCVGLPQCVPAVGSKDLGATFLFNFFLFLLLECVQHFGV